MPNFNSIGSEVSERQVAENRYLPLTGGIALTSVYGSCFTEHVLTHHCIISTLATLTTPQLQLNNLDSSVGDRRRVHESTNYSIAATVRVSIILRGWGLTPSSVELRSI